MNRGDRGQPPATKISQGAAAVAQLNEVVEAGGRRADGRVVRDALSPSRSEEVVNKFSPWLELSECVYYLVGQYTEYQN